MLQRQLLFPTLRFGKNQFVKDPDPISNEKFENHAYRLIDHVQGQLISPYFFILFSEFFLCVGRGHKPYFLRVSPSVLMSFMIEGFSIERDFQLE